MPTSPRRRRVRGRGAIPGLVVFAAVLGAAVVACGAQGQTIVVETAACRALTTHQPAPDVAYRPGVDATGRPVAPADLGGVPSPLVQSFTFDLNADLRRYLPAGSQLFQPQLGLGRVTIGADGAVLFNGQRLGGEDRAAVAALCRRSVR